MVSPFFPVFLMIISIFFKVVEQKSFETISVEHSKLHPYFSWWIKKKFFWPKVQSDQKGRCQKYLVISPKLFEPQKYIINSWVPKTGHLCWCDFLAYFYIFVSFLNQVPLSDCFLKASSFKVHQCSQIVNDFFSLVPARNKFTSLCTVKVASKNCLSGLQFLELWLVSYHSGNLQSSPSKSH